MLDRIEGADKDFDYALDDGGEDRQLCAVSGKRWRGHPDRTQDRNKREVHRDLLMIRFESRLEHRSGRRGRLKW